MILLIDNYDSFSYNVYQLVGSVNPDVKVIRNDGITVDEIGRLAPAAIILSPGPGRPADAGICIEVIKSLGRKTPVLGICLGHQAICEAFGATVSYAKTLMHGKTSSVAIDTQSRLFSGMQGKIKAARYHSLAVVKDTLPDCLRITAETADGEVMAIEHTEYPIYGVQFHPESVLTPDGEAIIRNFLEDVDKK
ncbi:MAG: aminodeoxychorismate/anthranilate synthase component II [Firmicutes bacterium HGW-Firmicutes-21]|nr:MAG: aminodeoxychorismate/anthranilate synthase component II [Firmicutes bacterium HGW-Firmicutes-21]